MGFVSLTEALDLTTPAGRAMAGLLNIFAEFEREILRERTRAGLANARQNGKDSAGGQRPRSTRQKSGSYTVPGLSRRRSPAVFRLDAPPYVGFWDVLFPGEICCPSLILSRLPGFDILFTLSDTQDD